MTILQSKSGQQGDSDDPPPKKKAKKLKSSTRSQAPVHVASSSNSLPGPSRRTEHRDYYSYLSSNLPYLTSEAESSYLQTAPSPYYDHQSDRVIVQFKLDKLDVGTPPKLSQPDPFTSYHSEFDDVAGPSHTQQVHKTQIYNPDCLEYYIYGPGSRSPNSRAHSASASAPAHSVTATVTKPAVKRPLPEFDQIEVLSSEDIQSQSQTQTTNSSWPAIASSSVTSDVGGSLLDDINNFDFDDKFGELEKFQQDAIWEDSKMYHLENRSVNVMISGYEKTGSATGGHPHHLHHHHAPHHHHHNHNNNEETSMYAALPRTTFRSAVAPASLSNLGNTCFLNSVLYTLRFAPNFLHNLHHLVTDMNANVGGAGQPVSNSTVGNVHQAAAVSLAASVAKKTSSLGRNLSLMSWPRERDKDPATGAGDLTATIKTKKQIVTERLHEVYESMRTAEAKDSSDPFHPDVFLTALREVNPIFEGNQQQDAHELLVCLLDIFRETYQASARQAETRAAIQAKNYCLRLQSNDSSLEKKTVKQRIPLKNKSVKSEAEGLSVRMKNEKNTIFSSVVKLKNKRNIDESDVDSPSPIDDEKFVSSEIPNLIIEPTRPVDNFVARDFEGVMVLRTTCLECGNTTEKREPFADICVPIKTDYNDDEDGDRSEHPLNPSELYERAVVTDEFLRDRNKYYCEECLRYNEARRSVRYQTLPRLLTLQLKRFSSTYGAMSKVTQFMPTPMTLACFCEDCRAVTAELNSHTYSAGTVRGGTRAAPSLRPITVHVYELYGVIMHLGPNMAGGHYIAYVRMTDSAEHYKACTRTVYVDAKNAGTQNTTNNKFINLFKTKANAATEKMNLGNAPRKLMCRGAECCGVRGTTDPELIAGYKYEPEPAWLACDDDNVKALSASEVEDLLAKNSTSNATPYLLFYARRTDGL